MTDEQRAMAWWIALVEVMDDLSDEGIAGRLAKEFAAVRAEERKAIVAWLVERHGLHGVARAVERGAHEAST